jgi:hypothetical protein
MRVGFCNVSEQGSVTPATAQSYVGYANDVAVQACNRSSGCVGLCRRVPVLPVEAV